MLNFKKSLLFLYTIKFFTCAQRRHFSYRTMPVNKLHLMISAKVIKILFTTLIYNLKSVDISNTSNSEWLTKLVSCQHSWFSTFGHVGHDQNCVAPWPNDTNIPCILTFKIRSVMWGELRDMHFQTLLPLFLLISWLCKLFPRSFCEWQWRPWHVRTYPIILHSCCYLLKKQGANFKNRYTPTSFLWFKRLKIV